MVRLFFAAILAYNCIALAQLQPSDINPQEVTVPILINPNQQKTGDGGLVSVEATEQNPNALNLIRAELNKMEETQQGKEKSDGLIWSTTKRFTPETATFFVSVGAVTFMNIWTRSHGDPLAMEKHIMSLKDPIAHLSFYSFMISQGFYMNFHTGSAKFNNISAFSRQQMLKRLSFQSMAVGSLASSIVADLGYSIKMCVNKWVNGYKDDKSLEMCNQAWKQWTIRKKVTQYFPQIITMWAAQATTEMLEGAFKIGFEKVVAKDWALKLAESKAANGAVDFLTKKIAVKITAFDVVLTLCPEGWGIKGISWVGKVIKFAGFVAVNDFLNNYVNRPVDDLTKPMFFEWDAVKINTNWAIADATKWDLATVKNDDTQLKTFEKEVEKYGEEMQEWRDHLNAESEGDIAAWMDMTRKLLNQIDYSYKFYQSFSETLFDYASKSYKILRGDLSRDSMQVSSRYPFRTLPLYGVKPGEYIAVGGEIGDLYLLNPNELEMRQKEHVLNVAKKYGSASFVQSSDNLIFKTIIENLGSGDLYKMAAGLNDIQFRISTFIKQQANMDYGHLHNIGTPKPYSDRGLDFIKVMKSMLAELGNPTPITAPFQGFARAFGEYGPNKALSVAADYTDSSFWQNFYFPNSADLMMYNLICGPNQSNFYKQKILGANVATPRFQPPNLLMPGTDTGKYCEGQKNGDSIYTKKINDQSLQDFLMKNINWAAIGNFKTARNPENFNSWWKTNASIPSNIELKEYDKNFEKLFNISYDNYFNHRNLYKKIVDNLNQGLYFPNSMEASLKAETSFYLHILERALYNDSAAQKAIINPTPPADNSTWWQKSWSWIKSKSFDLAIGPTSGLMHVSTTLTQTTGILNYLEFTTNHGGDSRFTPLYDQKEPLEIFSLNYLFNQYHDFIRYRTSDSDFDRYIGHAKRVDTALNDALVALGLKRKVKGPAYDEIENFSKPSQSGNENTAGTYEDVPLKTLTYKQRMGIAAIKGLRLVEAQVRRFIRMNFSLSQSLVVENKELLYDFMSHLPPTKPNNLFNNPYSPIKKIN